MVAQHHQATRGGDGTEHPRPGFPPEMVDDEPEEPGYEVVPKGQDASEHRRRALGRRVDAPSLNTGSRSRRPLQPRDLAPAPGSARCPDRTPRTRVADRWVQAAADPPTVRRRSTHRSPISRRATSRSRVEHATTGWNAAFWSPPAGGPAHRHRRSSLRSERDGYLRRRAHGISIDVVPSDATGQVDVEERERRMDGDRTRRPRADQRRTRQPGG